MSKEFKLKIKSDAKLHIGTINFSKLILKIKGKTNRGEIFNANISILIKNKQGKMSIEKITISKLEIESSSDNLSLNEYRDIYNINSSFDSCSSSSSSSDDLNDLYEQLNIFAKNIKFSSDNKGNYINFTLDNSNIKKMKLRGKLN